MSQRNSIILLVVLVILAGILYWSMQNNPLSKKGTGNNSGQSAETTEDTSAGSIHAGGSAPTISYKSALDQYLKAHMEFDQDCKASPGSLTLADGTILMIDNQSPSDRVVKVGSLMNIKANSFKLVKVSKDQGSTWNIDCDQMQNVATVTIQ